MDIAGEYTFDAPQQLVWNALQDPDVLGSVMPGGEAFTKIGENEYTGKLKIKVGPVQGTFDGTIKLSDMVAPTSYTIGVDGKGAPGIVKATGSMTLEARGDQTHMQYSGSAQIGGRIASVGQRLMDSSARSIIRQSLDGLNAYLKAQAAQQQPATPVAPPSSPAESGAPPAPVIATPVAPTSVPAYKPPSQTQVALTVMRDVLNDMIPPAMQPVVAVGVIIVILVILYVVSR